MTEIEKYKNISTKISPDSFKKLKKIADKSGLKVYYLLQIVVDSYLKCFDTANTISEDTQKVVDSFAKIELEKDKLHLCNGSTRSWKCNNILAILGDKGHPDTQIIALGKHKDVITQTINNDTILKLFLKAYMPELLPMLKIIQKENKLFFLSDALKFAIDEIANDSRITIEDEINEMFSDNCRTEFGEVYDYSDLGRYVKRNSRNEYKRNNIEK